jgi:glycosyltransferase involved in cell wall biosynthesis
MKILFDHQIFSAQKYGGISRYFVNIANKMSDIGENVRICAPIHKNCFLKESSRHLSSGFYFKFFPPKTIRIIKEINHHLSKRTVSIWNPDIVHETYYNSNFVAKKNVVLTVYDMIHEIYPESFARYDNTSKLKKMAVSRASHIICISEQTKRDLINLFNVKECKITVIHLGFNIPSVVQNDASSFVINKRPYLLYVGLRSGYKNFEKFITGFASSAKLVSDYNIICFGGGPFNAHEKELIVKIGLSGHSVIQFSGNDQALANLYLNASALVYPSLYEGFGLPPLEAMAYNCPVVCSNTSSIPEVVGDAAEMFDPHDEESIRASIESVVFNDSFRDYLIYRGKERLNVFSWNRCAQETLDVYRRVLS